MAFALLAVVGGKALEGVFRDDVDTDGSVSESRRELNLIVLSAATSIEALRVGLSLALLQVVVRYAAALMGAVNAGLTICGMPLGFREGGRFGLRVRLLGGFSLIATGFKKIVEHNLMWSVV
ncbi:MAG: hypothetical protein GX443_14725 [Deltaproteobacteria bacterium]|nr:hypothetical protein [Deltaproteobacteria bacterium]